MAEINSTFEYDLKVGKTFEKKLGEIFENKTVEVKTDFYALGMGSVYVEYESRNKPSGILTSQADYYCFFIVDGGGIKSVVLVKTPRLKVLFKKYYDKGCIKKGGDNLTSKGVIIPLDEILGIN